MTLALLTSEIHAYWALREGHFARELMVSVTWGVYATALIVIGLRKRYAPIRYFAIVVFAVTIVKVFAVDMAELDRIYRVVQRHRARHPAAGDVLPLHPRPRA